MPTSGFTDLLEQSNYLYEGQIAQTEEVIVRTGYNSGSVVIIPGRGVVRGTGDRALLLPVDASSVFLGIAIENGANVKRSDSSTAFSYAVNAQIAYLVRGTIGVLVDQDVVAGSQAFIRFTATTGNSQKGVFRADVATVSTVDQAVAVPNSRYLRSATAGSVVGLSINLA